ncbi:MAG: SDR family NAD(P)-dependent oxidoreductase [Oscillospiraceae bacterium]|jgi:3-oxoacyl-[acyl-carrier protein] reductase|nr:SDR family NAD(P)-dependent oxidoreductase [Oscillospiraceae bacterium]
MNKTVLITGASRGIGKETARIFAASGCNVIINYLKSEKKSNDFVCELTNKKLSAIAIKADVSNTFETQNMIDKIIEKFGKIDILVNNAGVSLYKQIQDTTYEDFCKIMNVNVWGVFNCCKLVSPHMINKKSGIIINVSSIWGEQGASCEVAYSTSKAAIIGFSKALKKELEPSNISVEYITPGFVRTDMTKVFINGKINKELGEVIAPSQVAHEIFKIFCKNTKDAKTKFLNLETEQSKQTKV